LKKQLENGGEVISRFYRRICSELMNTGLIYWMTLDLSWKVQVVCEDWEKIYVDEGSEDFHE
jgi:hypothetical protein